MSFSVLFIAFICSAVNLFAGRLQDTGVKPDRYETFGQPWDALHIVEKYLPSNPVIIEAGAFDGNESCTLARHWPQGHVHAFEPVSYLFERVKENTQFVPNITAYNFALGDHCGDEIMYLSTDGWGQSSSLLPPKDHLIYSTVKFNSKEIVPVTTLDQWAKDNYISHVDMLWLDMQGFELPALKKGMQVLKNVSVIITELEFCEAYEGQPLYQEVRDFLEEQGFVLVAGNFSFPKDPGQWFGDGLFVKANLIK